MDSVVLAVMLQKNNISHKPFTWRIASGYPV